MNEKRPLFCDTGLAERIERAEARLISEAGEAARHRAGGPKGFVIPIAGGVATFVEEGSPLNKVAGLGFAGVPGADALDEVERAFFECGSPVQVELSNLADQEIGVLLTGRRYRLVSYENVLGLSLENASVPDMPSGVEVRPSGDEEFDVWLDVVVEGFAHPDAQGVPSHEEFPREILEKVVRDMAAVGVTRYLATRSGVPAGGASVRLADGIAQLAGAPRPRPLIAVTGCRPRCRRPASPTPRPPGVTSPSSPLSRGPSRSRMCSVRDSTCCTPARSS